MANFPVSSVFICSFTVPNKFWCAPIRRNRSRDAIVSPLSVGLSAHFARFLVIFAQNLALYNKNTRVLPSLALCVIGSLGNVMLKLHISHIVFWFTRSYVHVQHFRLRSFTDIVLPHNICCEHQISSGNLSHNSAFDRRILLF